MDNVIRIPYKPRTAQQEIHAALDKHRMGVVVAHRRFGKTVAMVNHLIKRSITDGKERGMYGYVAPYRNQAKSIAWDYLKHFAGVIPGAKFNEQELYAELPNSARIRIFGADNPDALRGLYFDGVILDEVAQMRPEVWGEIIRPALADREGWAVFIGTPKGINLFHDMYRRARSDKTGYWVALVFTVADTLKHPDPPLSRDEVEQARAEMGENAFRQEFMCDFTASAENILITIDVVAAASERVITSRDIQGMPVIIGVDVARFGADSTVFMRRQGLAAFPPLVLRGLDNKAVSERLVSYCHEHQPDAVFIDAGQGQGVIDWVNKLLPNIMEVPFGGRALSENKFLNRRSEMWYSMREWLVAGGGIPDDRELRQELSAPTYQFNAAGKIQLEAKDKIVERLGVSPDKADALALTFAAPVMPKAMQAMHLPRKAVRKSSLWD